MLTEPYFFKLSMDGELLAEMPIFIKNQAKAWKAFQAVFAAVTPQIVGEFFEAMRIACDPELLKNADKMGFTVELNPPPKPDLIIPKTNASSAQFIPKAIANGY